MTAAPAAAQVESWIVLTEEQDPSVIAVAIHCPVFDEASGQAFCLSIGCTPNDPFSFGFSFVGYDQPDDRDTAATYTIDGQSFDPVAMRLIGLGALETIAAAYDEGRHAPLLEALRRGLQMEVRFTDDILPQQGFPLNRSLVSIDQARSLCAASDAVPATTLIGQRVEIWDMIAGDPDDEHLADFLPDGTLRLTLNGVETLSTWSEGPNGALCLNWPDQPAQICGAPEINGRDVSLRLLASDGMLVVRLAGTLLGAAS
jgi:hypothetical protein